MKKKRLYDLDNAKGLAIFLVVLGHIVATDVPHDNEWYAILKMYIYKFHMPFFIFLSGMIMAYTYNKNSSAGNYGVYIRGKLKRLAPGFFIFGAIIYFGKLAASRFVYVDDIPGDISSEIFKLLVIPSESAGGSLWFIYVLMEMYIMFPLIIMLTEKRPEFLLLIGLVLHFLPSTKYFLIDRLFEYSVFFSLGIYATWNLDRYLNLIDKYIILFAVVFIISFYTIPYLSQSDSKLIIGLLSIPTLHGLVRLKFFPGKMVWSYFGKYTYSIYLMNTIFIGITKGILLIFTPWDGQNFLWIAPLLLVAGIYGPAMLKDHIFTRFNALNRITS